MREYLKVKNGDKIHVEEVATLSYLQYGVFRDDNGNLYYQFTDDCAEIERCNSNDLEREIEELEEMFKEFE